MDGFEAGEIFDELLEAGSDPGRRGLAGLPPLFGGWRHIPAAISVAAFALVIGIVNVLERMFHWLHERTHETAFHEMVLAIEKELMIAGTMAFILKMILNTSDFLDLEWLYALEFADLVIPITAFLYCFIGSILIIVSVFKMDLWSQAYNMNLVELLHQFYDSKDHSWLGRLYWFPVSFATSKMEFRIMHNIFCEQYHINRDAFPFDDYIRVSWEQYLINIVEIGPQCWLLVISALGLNWVRSELDLSIPDLGYTYKSCNSTSTSGRRLNGGYDEGLSRRLAAADEGCDYSHIEESLVIFMCIGLFIFIWTSVIALFSRVYILRLFSSYGIESLEDYATFVKLIEHDHEFDLTPEEKKLSTGELKQAVEEVKSRMNRRKLLQKPSTPIMDFIEMLCPWFFEKPPDFSQFEEDETDSVKATRTSLNSRSINKIAIYDDDDGDDEEAASSSAKVKKQTPSPPKVSVAELRGTMKRFQSVIPPIDTRIRDIAENMESHKYSMDLKTIFLFKNPELYFQFIDLLMMSISCYLSFWICNYLTALDKLPSDETFWKVAALAPGLISAALFSQIVETAVILHSISQLNPDRVEDILEQREMASQLGQFVREKILKRLKSMGEGREYLEQLFRAIDTNNSDLLSRSEFKIFCVEMSISFSERRWRQIFREIDRNADNEISFDELFFFLYPESIEALEKEKSRLEELDVAAREKELMSYLTAGDHHYAKEMEAIKRIGSNLRRGHGDSRISKHMDKVKSFRSQASELTGRSSLTPEKNQTKPSTSASCKPYEKDTWSGSKQVVNISTANTAGADGSNLSIKVPGKAEYKVVEGKGKFVDVQMTANSSSVSQHQDHDEDEWDGDEMDA